MDKNKLRTMVVGLILFGLMCGFVMLSVVAFPENPNVYSYFNKIAEMPHIYHEDIKSTDYFWEHGGDCDDRALAFKEYLESKGAADVHIYRVHQLENGTFVKSINNDYGHAFIVWNGKAYNPSLDKSRRFYDYDLNTYLNSLKEKYGYNVIYIDNNTNQIPF
jgi:hypothetical protein